MQTEPAQCRTDLGEAMRRVGQRQTVVVVVLAFLALFGVGTAQAAGNQTETTNEVTISMASNDVIITETNDDDW